MVSQFQFQPSFLNSYLRFDRFGLSVWHFKSAYIYTSSMDLYSTTSGNSFEDAPPLRRSHVCRSGSTSFQQGSLSHSEGRLPPCQRRILSTYIDSRCTSACVAWAGRIWFNCRKKLEKNSECNGFPIFFVFCVLCLRLLHSRYTIHTYSLPKKIHTDNKKRKHPPLLF